MEMNEDVKEKARKLYNDSVYRRAYGHSGEGESIFNSSTKSLEIDLKLVKKKKCNQKYLKKL